MFRNRLFLLILLLCFYGSAAQAESLVKVSLIIGDTNSRAAIEGIKIIDQEYPWLKERTSFKIYLSRRIRDNDLSFIKDSSLIFVFIMGREFADALKPEIEEALKKGAKVYAFGGTYEAQDRQMGIILDKKIGEYYNSGGPRNLKNMVLYALKKDFSFAVSYEDARRVPEFGIYDYRTKRILENFEEYKKVYPIQTGGNPWIGIVFYKSSITSGQDKLLNFLFASLESAHYNVLPVYGYPSEAAMERFFFDPQGKSRVRLVVALAMKMGVNPQSAIPILDKLDVPVINAITLYGQSRDEWEESALGLDISERVWQIGIPEMAGIIQPTVVASKEKITDTQSGLEYIEDTPISERIERLTQRITAWINLQDKPNSAKRIALIYYNYPPGKENIGASYLNVLPESLWEIFNRLKLEGYDLGDKVIDKSVLFNDIHRYGRNIGNWAPGELSRMCRYAQPILVPLVTYKEWFEQLPAAFKESVLKSWGPVEESKIMLWQDSSKTRYIVIPKVRYGNILFLPQPSRGWEQDDAKLYHDNILPPHHQYIAFYLWLKKEFKADALAHIGTHGTQEWLSGKEVGFSQDDPPEACLQDSPNIYPYVVDNVGEGLQAKRRGMAVIIDHMTPPFDKAGLNKELKELAGLLNDYTVARDKSQSLALARLKEINELAGKIGILTDLKLEEIKTAEEIEEVEHYLSEIAQKQTPFGLHTFGKSPEERYINSTAEAIASIEKGLPQEERRQRIAQIRERIIKSGPSELDSFTAGLSGRYISPAQGSDPIRNPDSLPTGKNFYSFDPARIPAKGVYEMGVSLAKELIEDYKYRHGSYPDKLTFNLWGTETIRNEGVMESQIMYLMGVKPKWDERLKVAGLEVIPRQELKRQRIDVTIVPSGLYRDLFPHLMSWLDQAVGLAKEERDDDNILRANILKTKQILMERGIAEKEAESLAAVRLFTEASGTYGPNLDTVISKSNTWDNEAQVADVYFMRMSYLYGQGFWGKKLMAEGRIDKANEDVSLLLFKTALSGSKIAIHSKSGNLYAALDNDDFFQYLGGTAMAIRAVDGQTPEVYVTNMSNPNRYSQETIEKFMGREMRSRYLNPEWIKAMFKEGYAGARFIAQVAENLWGWQVTVPEVVDKAKWNEIYETYVLDKNGLGIKELFRQSKNIWAYQSILARMLETIRKGYWSPDKKVIAALAAEYAESVKEVGLACAHHICANPPLAEFTLNALRSVPGLEKEELAFRRDLQAVQDQGSAVKSQMSENKIDNNRRAVPSGNSQAVEGYEMQDVRMSQAVAIPAMPYMFIAGFLTFIGLIALGWWRRI